MAELENLSKYISSDLKEAIEQTLSKVVKQTPMAKSNDLLDRSTQSLGYTKILKQGFTP